MSDERVPLDLTAGVDVPEVVRPALRRIRRRLAAVGLLVVLLSGGASYFVSHRKARIDPVKQLKGNGYVNPQLVAAGQIAGKRWSVYASPLGSDGGGACLVSVSDLSLQVGGCSSSEGLNGAPVFLGSHTSNRNQPAGEPPFTALFGETLGQVATVRILPDRGPPIRLRTTPVAGTKQRVFAGVAPRTIAKAEAEAYDSHGKLIPEPPIYDVRRRAEGTPEQLRVIAAAISAGGDPDAQVVGVTGPIPFAQALASRTQVKNLLAEPRAPAYVVDLLGRFSSRQSSIRIVPPLKSRAWFVLGPSAQLMSSGPFEEETGNQ